MRTFVRRTPVSRRSRCHYVRRSRRGAPRHPGRRTYALIESIVSTSAGPITKPLRAMGGLVGMSLDVFAAIFTTPVAWREYLFQPWFVARVSLLRPLGG